MIATIAFTIQKQTDSSVLNTVDRDGEFVNAIAEK